MRREIVEAQKQGYLKCPRHSRALYDRWYDICADAQRPFIAWQGNHLRIDLICMPFRFTKVEQHDLTERWRNSTCQEPNHRYRHVYGGVGDVGLGYDLCSHTMPAFAEHAIGLVLRKAAD